MDAIKKKMQAMKLEKDNAMDRADACEQQAKDANLRAERVRFFITCISSTIFEENSEKEDLIVKAFDPKIWGLLAKDALWEKQEDRVTALDEDILVVPNVTPPRRQ